MGKEWDNFSDRQHKSRQREKDAAEQDGRWLEGRGTLPYSFSPDAGRTKKERDNFIAFLREVMTEALRVLKPGGHALVWALPRTSHWTAMALEDAGFECRDKLYHIFGSGFPKSTAIDKQIDKMQGAEREVIGPYVRLGDKKPYPTNVSPDVVYGSGMFIKQTKGDITAPATPEARQWQGYGTALKPSVEEWILCRKPLAESSIAAQVLATGTGALAIDQCRVNANGEYLGRPVGQPQNAYEWSKHPNPLKGQITSEPQGRFPSTLLLSHSVWCVPTGTRKVSANRWGKGNERNNNGVQGVTWPKGAGTGYGHEDQDGTETIEAYDCTPDCPVRRLDEQSGIRSAGYRKNPSTNKTTWFGATDGSHIEGERGYQDQGGASRYFQSFPPSLDADDFVPYLYTSKASRRERNEGCEDLPEGEKPSTVYLNNRRCRNCGKQQVSGSPCQCPNPDWEIIERGKKGNNGMSATNTHPT